MTDFRRANWFRVLLAAALLLAPLVPGGASHGEGTGGTPPVAIISAPSVDPILNYNSSKTVLFVGSFSYDLDGQVREWRWDFGDGDFATTPDAIHTFSREGLYMVYLTVTDNDGLTARDWRRVTVIMRYSPVARISAPPGGSVFEVGQEIALRSDGSRDPGGGSLRYLWDFDDGTVSSETQPVHSFPSPGFYHVSLTVRSRWGDTATAQSEIMVRPQFPTSLAWTGNVTILGDWTFADESITLDGNLTVEGNLTLSGSELVIDRAQSGESGIVVAPGGKLVLEKASRVLPARPEARFGFRVLPGASLRMDGTLLSGCGQVPRPGSPVPLDRRGLYILSEEVSITGSTITACGIGMIIDGPSAANITGNDLSFNDGEAILVLNGSSPVIRGNLLRGNLADPGRSEGHLAAILSVGSSPLITENTISAERAGANTLPLSGIELQGPGRPVLIQNTISRYEGTTPGTGVIIDGSDAWLLGNSLAANTVGIDVRGGSPRLKGNTVNGTGLGTHTYSTRGLVLRSSGSNLTGNTFTGYDFGVLVSGSSSPSFEGDRFAKNIHGVAFRSDEGAGPASITNCTFSENRYDLALFKPDRPGMATVVILTNSSFDPGRVLMEDPAGSLTVRWPFRVRVLERGSEIPLSGAAVSLTDARGLLAGKLGTGADGWTAEVMLDQWTWTGDGIRPAAPYNVTARKDSLSSLPWSTCIDESRALVLSVHPDPGEVVVIAADGNGRTDRSHHPGDPVGFSAVGLPESGEAEAFTLWDFGDGRTAQGALANHTYSKPGRYQVIYTVSCGNVSISGKLSVEVRAPLGRPAAMDPGPLIGAAFLLVVLAVGIGYVFGTEMGISLLFSLAMLLYSKISRVKVLDNFIRGKIYGYILANPGDHYNAIMAALCLSNGTFAYHIRMLERENLVKSQADGLFKRFYPAEMVIPENDKIDLTKIQRIICEIIAEKPGINQREIASILNLSSATINYHIDTLITKKIVRRERVGMKVRYYPVPTGKLKEDNRVAAMLIPPL